MQDKIAKIMQWFSSFDLIYVRSYNWGGYNRAYNEDVMVRAYDYLMDE